MYKVDKPGAVTPSKPSNTDCPQRRKRSGIYLESTEAEQLGVLPHECTRVKDAMSRSVSTVSPSTEIREAVRLMKMFEDRIRIDPAQYMWVWKRFSRRPPEYPDIYKR